MLTLKNIKKNKDANAIIYLPLKKNDRDITTKIANRTVSGIIQGEFGFSSRANYSSPFYNETLGKINAMISQIGQGLNSFFGDLKIPSVSLTNIRQTIKTWTNTDSPVFALSLLFIATEPDDDVRVPIALLESCVYPKFGNIQQLGTLGSSLYLNAPNNYMLTPSNNRHGISADGLTAFSISDWLFIKDLLLTNVDPKYCTKLTEAGYPLWALVSLSFEPFRMFDSEDIISIYSNIDLDINKFNGRGII